MVGVEAVDLVQHVSEELVAALQNTESVEGLPLTGEHVVEHVPAQLLYPVLDHPVGDQDAAHRVRVVVGDTEQAGLVAWERDREDVTPPHPQYKYCHLTFVIVGNIDTVLQIKARHHIMSV